MPARMHARLPWLMVPLMTVGCGEPTFIDAAIDTTTRLRLTSDVFLGDFACAAGAGTVQSYVARLVDVTEDFDAGSAPQVIVTPAIPCDESVQFSAVFDRLYALDIEAFDTPSEGPSTDASPRWTASCGRGTPGHDPEAGVDPLGPTLAVLGQAVPFRGCTTLRLTGPASPTRVEVDLEDARSNLECGTGLDRMSHYRATLEGTTIEAACAEVARFDLPASALGNHVVEVTGFARASDGDAGLAGLDAGPAEADAATTAVTTDAAAPAVDASAAADASSEGDAAATDASRNDAGGIPRPDAGADDAGGTEVQNDQGVDDGVPRWTTRCVARATLGATTRANCEPLRLLPPR